MLVDTNTAISEGMGVQQSLKKTGIGSSKLKCLVDSILPRGYPYNFKEQYRAHFWKGQAQTATIVVREREVDG
jgi:hypothetical protein